MGLSAIKNKLKKNRKLYLIISPVFGMYRNSLMRMARLTRGIDGNKAVFCAFDSRSYNDNPRYISEELHRLRPETEIVWLFRDVKEAKAKYDIPDYVKCYNPIEKDGVREMATAKVLVDNFNKRSYLKFRFPQQVYVQTWHGDRAFKKVGYDNPGQYTYLIEEKCALCVCGSDYGERQYRSAFRYKGEVMKKGYPRNDILVRNDPEEEIALRKKMGLDLNTKYLIFAPTFRDVASKDHLAQRMPIDLKRVLATLERTTGETWKCLVRTHYMSYGLSMDDTSEKFIPMTDYPEMAELLRVSDAMITDYSSCAGDYALMRRPIWLYQDDIADYTGNNRGLYFNMEDSPYWVASTPEELDRLIEATTPEKAEKNCDDILEFYGTNETGQSARLVAEYIVSKLDPVRKSV